MTAKGKILVVDDDRLVLATLTHGLAQAGYEVIDADNGDDAILLARQHRPELALLDIRMEGKSGFDVAAYLRDYCQIPFMFLSAFSDPDTVAQVAALGAVAYLVKPLDVGQIVPTVEAAFERLRSAACRGRDAGAGACAAAGGECVAGRRGVAGGGCADASLFAVARRSLRSAAAHRRRGRRVRGGAGRAAGAGGRRAGAPRRAVATRARGRLAGPRRRQPPRTGFEWRCGLQREVKARAAAGFGFGPDVAAMAAHDALHRRQADAGAREVVGAVQALEHAEQAVGVAHVEAGAVVARR